jgi:unsaturated rhamnogalacturonyl hydrolase
LNLEKSLIDVAVVFAREYGNTILPINYVRGVPISGRLRLAKILDDQERIVSEIEQLVDPVVNQFDIDSIRFLDGSVHSGYLWAHDLTELTAEKKYMDLMVTVADLYLADENPIDADNRVEDIFFVGALMGRAYDFSKREIYSDFLFKFLEQVNPQSDSNLWWHSNSSPYYWGRGNAFAALGFAEALSFLPATETDFQKSVTKHRAHLDALISYQHESGAWSQVIDNPDTYLELTSTAILGYVLARGIRGGWLSQDYFPYLEKAWIGISNYIDSNGQVRNACAGTGPLSTLLEYIQRPTVEGHDDRSGGFVLWFAVEYASLLMKKPFNN